MCSSDLVWYIYSRNWLLSYSMCSVRRCAQALRMLTRTSLMTVYISLAFFGVKEGYRMSLPLIVAGAWNILLYRTMEPSLSNSFMYTLKPVIVTCDPTPRLITEQANYLGLCGRFGASLRRIDMPPLRRHFLINRNLVKFLANIPNLMTLALPFSVHLVFHSIFASAPQLEELELIGIRSNTLRFDTLNAQARPTTSVDSTRLSLESPPVYYESVQCSNYAIYQSKFTSTWSHHAYWR